MKAETLLPFLRWARSYNKQSLIDDSIAAVIISMVMIPQSLAYAMLAGLPPQLGLYASILPLLIYAFFGSSSALSVGPFAISSILTASALQAIFPESSATEILVGAATLALCSGLFLVAFGLLRLGFLNNFLSFPVITGFISASALVIAASQIGNLLGIRSHGENLIILAQTTLSQLSQTNLSTLFIGISGFLIIFIFPKMLTAAGKRFAWPTQAVSIIGKTAPLLAMIFTTACVMFFQLDQQGVLTLGAIPAELPALSIPDLHRFHWSIETWKSLFSSAILISIIGFVSAISISQSFAIKRRQRINPNQEAVALGMANLGAGFSGAFPISASLSRSAVSFNAGARTPAAGGLTAVGITLATLFLTPLLYHLPIAVLAALILNAVISLVDISAIKRISRYSYKDFSAMTLTALLTLTLGVETGLLSGVLLSIFWHLYWSSNPHTAIVGKLPNTEHFRNTDRHKVELDERIISFRLDSSLYFANARFLENRVNQLIASHPKARHLVLMCSAINDIDVSGLESLFAIDHNLRNAGITFHLSEVKGPVMDRLKQSHFIEQMSGNIYVSHFQAWTALLEEAPGPEAKVKHRS
jgi:SulP family sulfate permease